MVCNLKPNDKNNTIEGTVKGLDNTAKRVSEDKAIDNSDLLIDIMKLEKGIISHHKYDPDTYFANAYVYVYVKAISIRSGNKFFTKMLSMPYINLDGNMDKGLSKNETIIIKPLDFLLSDDSISNRKKEKMLYKFPERSHYYVSDHKNNINPLTFTDVTLAVSHLLYIIFHNDFCIDFFNIKGTVPSDNSDSDSDNDRSNDNDNIAPLSDKLFDRAKKISKDKKISNQYLFIVLMALKKVALHHKHTPGEDFANAYMWALAASMRIGNRFFAEALSMPFMDLDGSTEMDFPRNKAIAIEAIDLLPFNENIPEDVGEKIIKKFPKNSLYYVIYHKNHIRPLTFNDVVFTISHMEKDIINDDSYIDFFHLKTPK